MGRRKDNAGPDHHDDGRHDLRDGGRGGDDDARHETRAFSLFCAYHLGLDPQGKKREMNIHDVARAVGGSTDDVNADLVRFGLTSERLMNLDFDLAAARDDVWASPPGVDLPSIARMHFDLLRGAVEKPRDWEQEARDDADFNARVFGKR